MEFDLNLLKDMLYKKRVELSVGLKHRLIEIRDAGTCITAIAIKTDPVFDEAYPFFARGGWSKDTVILIKCNGECVANYDPFEWRSSGNRTMFEAHRYIQDHFEELEYFSVVDVEYILGITDTPKSSEIWRKNESDN